MNVPSLDMYYVFWYVEVIVIENCHVNLFMTRKLDPGIGFPNFPIFKKCNTTPDTVRNGFYDVYMVHLTYQIKHLS